MKKFCVSLAVRIMAIVMLTGLLPYDVPAAEDLGIDLSEPVLVTTNDDSVISFPDSNFEAAVREVIGKPKGYIFKSDVEEVTYLNVRDKGIKSLAGIEYFTSLEALDCYNNQLTELDVSKNTALTYLYCKDNQLATLDVSGCTALMHLVCGFNQLAELDVSKNTVLIHLSCGDNQLAMLDVSNNSLLKYLDCGSNPFTVFDISKNTALTELFCYSNQLTELNVSKNTVLKILDCYNNQLTEFNVSKNTELISLSLGNNQLAELDVSKNTELIYLSLDNNQLAELDVSKNTVLKTLECRHNNIPSEANIIGLNKSVTTGFYFDPQNTSTPPTSDDSVISFPDSNFEALVREVIAKPEGDIFKSDVEAVKYFNVSNRDIESLSGIEYFTNLKTLNCHGNKLAELDVSKNTALTHLLCYDNQLTELDVSNNTALIYLFFNNNQLTELDVSKNKALIELDCRYNNIPSEANIIGINKSVISFFYFDPQNTLKEINYTNSLVLQNRVISGSVQENAENNTDSVKSSVIVLAIYDASGELVYSESKSCSLSVGVTPVNFADISISGANAGSYLVKVMCWNSFLNMEPLAQHKAFELK